MDATAQPSDPVPQNARSVANAVTRNATGKGMIMG
jgi:hypothetical protein